MQKYKLNLIKFEKEKYGSGNVLQWGIYEIQDGPLANKKILAYRDTDLIIGVNQDLSIALIDNGDYIRKVIKLAKNVANDNKVDYLCGHSLGGLIAEAVCSHWGIPGASFNAPGPRSSIEKNNLADGNKYNGVSFEVHVTSNDPVSWLGSAGGSNSSHIGKPHWHYHKGGHSMKSLREDIEKSNDDL